MESSVSGPREGENNDTLGGAGEGHLQAHSRLLPPRLGRLHRVCRLSPTARNNSLENLALPRMRKILLLLLEWFGPPRGAKRLPSWRSSVQGLVRLSPWGQVSAC